MRVNWEIEIRKCIGRYTPRHRINRPTNHHRRQLCIYTILDPVLQLEYYIVELYITYTVGSIDLNPFQRITHLFIFTKNQTNRTQF